MNNGWLGWKRPSKTVSL
jgi:hypothetical protein